MKIIGVLDGTFKHLPEIQPYIPCLLDIKTIQREDTKDIFDIAKVQGFNGKTVCIYPRGNQFAKKCCETIFT